MRVAILSPLPERSLSYVAEVGLGQSTGAARIAESLSIAFASFVRLQAERTTVDS
jgi:hypothetical protein